MRLLLRGEPATDVRHRAQEDGLGAGDASTHPPDAKRGATQGNAQLVNKGRALAEPRSHASVCQETRWSGDRGSRRLLPAGAGASVAAATATAPAKHWS